MLKMKEFQRVKRLAKNLVTNDLPPLIAVGEGGGLVIVTNAMLKERAMSCNTFVVLNCAGCPSYAIVQPHKHALVGLCAGKLVLLRPGVGRIFLSCLFENANSREAKRYANIQRIAERNGGVSHTKENK